MSHAARMPYDQRESTTAKWILIFIVLSLLAHVLIVAVIVLITAFMPVPKIKPAQTTGPTVSMTLVAPPPPPPQPKPVPSPKRNLFVPTSPEANVKPNPNTPIESDNDNALRSKNQARTPDTPLPDVTGQKNNDLDLQTTPLVQSTPTPQVQSTPPTPKQEKPNPQLPRPPQPQAQPKPNPNPAKPTPKAEKPPPPKPPPPQPTKNQVDPNTGLPVLPPINAPTLAPQTSQPQQPQKVLTQPPPSFQVNRSDISGSAGAVGDPSAATRDSPLGRYKAKVYRAVGSHWYQGVGQSQSLLPVGTVRVQFTISADGTVTTKVLDAGSSTMQMLLSISINSITDSAPFDKFDDYPGMREELIKEQGGDGSSYIDDFTFSVY